MVKTMKYDAILFDLDNTLMDFDASEQAALSITIKQFFSTFSHDSVEKEYHRINHRMWKELEEGIRKTPENIGIQRFEELATLYPSDVSASEIAETYLQYLGQQTFLMPGVLEMLQSLSKHLELAILSNGIEKVQQSRLRDSPISPYFAYRLTSEKAGVSKPDPAIFDQLIDQIQQKDRSRILMIGDSLKSDIQGAWNAGIPSCWYNPQGKELDSSVKPDYQINNWKELPDLLN